MTNLLPCASRSRCFGDIRKCRRLGPAKSRHRSGLWPVCAFAGVFWQETLCAKDQISLENRLSAGISRRPWGDTNALGLRGRRSLRTPLHFDQRRGVDPFAGPDDQTIARLIVLEYGQKGGWADLTIPAHLPNGGKGRIGTCDTDPPLQISRDSVGAVKTSHGRASQKRSTVMNRWTTRASGLSYAYVSAE
jgi:hypothetical protein